MKKTSILLLAIILLGNMILVDNIDQIMSGKALSNSVTKIKSTSISIDGNTELENFVSAGTGTKSDPYIIHNQNINANCQKSSTPGISISNTNMYLRVENITFTDCFIGILLSNVKNIVITNIEIRNATMGIKIDHSSQVNILSTHISLTSQSIGPSNPIFSKGIDISYSSYINLLKNSVSSKISFKNTPISVGEPTGYRLEESENCNLTENFSQNNSVGYEIYNKRPDKQNNILINNQVLGDRIGFIIIRTDDNSFIDNKMDDCIYGFFVEESNYNNFAKNSIINSNYGFYMHNATNSFLNNGIDNGITGFILHTSNNNSFNSTLIQNTNTGFNLNQSNNNIISDTKFENVTFSFNTTNSTGNIITSGKTTTDVSDVAIIMSLVLLPITRKIKIKK